MMHTSAASVIKRKRPVIATGLLLTALLVLTLLPGPPNAARAGQDGSATVRIVHAAPGAPALAIVVTLGEFRVERPVSFGEAGIVRAVPAGDLRLIGAAAADPATVLLDAIVGVAPNGAFTIILTATGGPEAPLEALTVEETPDIAAGEGRLRLIFATAAEAALVVEVNGERQPCDRPGPSHPCDAVLAAGRHDLLIRRADQQDGGAAPRAVTLEAGQTVTVVVTADGAERLLLLPPFPTPQSDEPTEGLSTNATRQPATMAGGEHGAAHGASSPDPAATPALTASPAAGLPAAPATATVTAVATAPPSPVATPAATPTAAGPPRSGATLLADSFESPFTGILPGSSVEPSRYEAGYRDGEYLMRRLPSTGDPTSRLNLVGNYTDSSMAIDARLVGEAAGRHLFIGCRYEAAPAGTNGYRLLAYPARGEVLIARYDGGRRTPLLLRPTPALRRETATNRLEFTCAGDVFTVTINGMLVARVTDSTYRSGQLYIGVGVSSDPLPAEARFDNLAVMQP